MGVVALVMEGDDVRGDGGSKGEEGRQSGRMYREVRLIGGTLGSVT